SRTSAALWRATSTPRAAASCAASTLRAAASCAASTRRCAALSARFLVGAAVAAAGSSGQPKRLVRARLHLGGGIAVAVGLRRQLERLVLGRSAGGQRLRDDRARRGDARLGALLIELRALGAEPLRALSAHGLGIGGGSGVY